MVKKQRKPYKVVPNVFVYEDKYLKLEKDSVQWILTYKERGNGKPKYFTYLPHLLDHIAMHKVESKIIKKGLLEVINGIKDIKRAVIREISLISEEIAKWISVINKEIKWLQILRQHEKQRAGDYSRM